MSMLAVLMVNSWIQQDDAIAHTACVSLDCARAMFSGRVIPRLSDIAWPARSPYLSASTFPGDT